MSWSDDSSPVDDPLTSLGDLTVEDILNAKPQTCDYLFQGQIVRALCSMPANHGGGHGPKWRDPETGAPI